MALFTIPPVLFIASRPHVVQTASTNRTSYFVIMIMNFTFYKSDDIRLSNMTKINMVSFVINSSCCAVRASWAPLHTAYVKGLHSFYGVTGSGYQKEPQI